MNLIRRCVLILVSSLPAILPPAGRAQQPLSPRAVVDQVLLMRSLVGETPQWSPDGTQIAFLSSLGGLWSVSPEGGFPTRLASDLGTGGYFIPNPQMPAWSPDGAWIAYVSDKSGNPELWLWSARDGHHQQLTSLGGQRVNSFSWSPDSKWIAFGGNRYGSFDIWKVQVSSGDVYRMTSDTRLEAFPTWSPDGTHLYYVRMDDRWTDHDILEIRSTPSAEQPRLVARDTAFFDYGEGSTFGYPMVSPDGRSILFRSERSGWINYWAVPTAAGAPHQIAAEQSEQADGRWSPDGKSIAYVINRNGTHELRLVPVSGGPSRAVVTPQGMGVLAAPAWSPDGKRLSYTLATPTKPADLFVTSVESGQSRQLTFSAPGGGIDKQLVTPEKISFRSDSFTINAYLYKPPAAKPGERFPAIVLVHGGPTGNFSDTYQQQAQFFAREGYVLLLANIRGSSGYGRAFEMANDGCWGHCDLRDVVAGVEYLKKLPYVNRDKLGITGSSYGGFMSTAAITWAPSVFQAAIPLSGYPNRVSFVNEGEYRHIQQLAHEWGPFEQNQDLYHKNSPFFWIKDIQTPTFLIWGEGHFPESNQMREFANEMERLYKVYRAKAYPNENFYVMSLANTRQMMLDMLQFFDQYLKDKVVTSPGSEALSGR